MQGETVDDAGLAFKYRAFISYSHADETWARWLHRRLENYRVPSRLTRQSGAYGAVPRRIGRCFRDQAELSAASHLDETLQQALRDSQSLIIVCSPRSAGSHWVNQEIRYFQQLGRGPRIYALVVDGEPGERDTAGACFPPALLCSADGTPLHEPLAADARPGRDGRTDGFLKLAAGLLGVGFNELRRREQRRRARLLTGMASGALGVALVTTLLAVSAYHARNEARERRREADDLIKFMIGDLHDRLYPIGRLDVLDAASAKAMQYLDRGSAADLDDTALSERIAALRSIEDIRTSRGQMQEAVQAAAQAVADARELVRRHPQDAQTTYQLVSALFALGDATVATFQTDAALSILQEAAALLQPLRAAAPDDANDIFLDAQIHATFGYVYIRSNQAANAAAAYQACAELTAPLAARPQAQATHVRTHWRCRRLWGSMLTDSDHVDQSAPLFLQIAAQIPGELARYPDEAALRQILAGAWVSAAYAFFDAGWPDRAASAAQQAIDLCRSLLQQDTGNALLKKFLASALNAMTQTDIGQQRWQDADRVSGQAVQLLDELLKLNPKDRQNRTMLIGIHESRAGIAAHAAGGFAAASTEYAAAIDAAAGDDSPEIQLSILSAQLAAWSLASESDPDRAAATRSDAQRRIVRLDVPPPGLPADLKRELKAARMRFAYLDGDSAAGDALYAELRDVHDRRMYEYTQLRQKLCSRSPSRGGARCATIADWQPLARAPVITADR